MGYAGKLNLKTKARELRKAGLSIGNIQKKLKVSRSSVSIWVRDVNLTQKQFAKLYLNKKTGALRGCMVAALNKIEKRKRITKELLRKGKKEMGKLSKRDRFVIGVAMYFAEGDKVGESIGFSNSDPRAIKFMIDWYREFCKIPEDKFRCNLYIHDNLNELKARKYWSRLIKIPLSQFNKSYIVKNNPIRLRKTKHECGVLKVSASNVNLHREIMGWIDGVFEK